MDIQLGRSRTVRRAYGIDEIALVPGGRTVDPAVTDSSWTLGGVTREIPIIADTYVDKEFGTGCVKITPAHDFNDYAVGQRHQLEMISILTLDAKISDNAPETYRGMDRFEARKKVVADLDAEVGDDRRALVEQAPVPDRDDRVGDRQRHHSRCA
mgnify:CR=1 FL=1